MSDLLDWTRARHPSPPMAIGPWLADAEFVAPTAARLTDSGVAAMDRARARPGRVRDSAFHLLAADALITYACEAALEEEDPDEALWQILRRAAAGA